MQTIIWRELKNRKWSLIAYFVGSLLLLWMYVATFRSSQATAGQLQELVKTYPKALLEAIGMSDLSIGTVEQYLNMKHFSLLWPIISIIFAVSWSGSQIAGDIQNGTIGLLLDQPIKRWKLFVSKYLAGLAAIGMFTAISVFGVIPLAFAYDIPTHFDVLFMTWLLAMLFTCSVYSFGLWISTLASEKSHVYAVVSTTLIVSYAAYILAAIQPSLSWLSRYSVFHYFDTQSVLAGGTIGASSVIIFVLAIGVSSLLAARRFNRRDISI